MSPESAEPLLNVPLPALVALAVEHWRLSRGLAALPAARTATARHALRRMEDFLKLCELEARDLDGRPFDAGLAVRVVDSLDDPRVAHGQTVIGETVSPLVLWKGNVVKIADVVTLRGVSGSPSA